MNHVSSTMQDNARLMDRFSLIRRNLFSDDCQVVANRQISMGSPLVTDVLSLSWGTGSASSKIRIGKPR